VAAPCGTLYVWGGGSDAGATANFDGDPAGKQSAHASSVPAALAGARDLRFRRVACGGAHDISVTASGHVYSLAPTSPNDGSSAHPSARSGSSSRASSRPLLVERLWATAVAEVSCGRGHAAALDALGRVWTWGAGARGQLGRGGDGGGVGVCGAGTHAATPCPVARGWTGDAEDDAESPAARLAPSGFPGGWPARAVACGDNHTAACDELGRLVTWGAGDRGQLGHGRRTDEALPRPCAALSRRAVVAVTAGGESTLSVDAAGHVWQCPPLRIWGAETAPSVASVGNDSRPDCLPARVPGLPRGATAVAAGARHWVALLPAPGAEAGAVVTAADRAPLVPPLLELLAAARAPGGACDDGSDGGSSDRHRRSGGARGSLARRRARERVAAARLAAAVEDVFSSPGLILVGFGHTVGASEDASSVSATAAVASEDPIAVLRRRSRISPGGPAPPPPPGGAPPTLSPPLPPPPPPPGVPELDLAAVEEIYRRLLQKPPPRRDVATGPGGDGFRTGPAPPDPAPLVAAALSSALCHLLEGAARAGRAAARAAAAAGDGFSSGEVGAWAGVGGGACAAPPEWEPALLVALLCPLLAPPPSSRRRRRRAGLGVGDAASGGGSGGNDGSSSDTHDDPDDASLDGLADELGVAGSGGEPGGAFGGSYDSPALPLVTPEWARGWTSVAGSSDDGDGEDDGEACGGRDRPLLSGLGGHDHGDESPGWRDERGYSSALLEEARRSTRREIRRTRRAIDDAQRREREALLLSPPAVRARARRLADSWGSALAAAGPGTRERLIAALAGGPARAHLPGHHLRRRLLRPALRRLHEAIVGGDALSPLAGSGLGALDPVGVDGGAGPWLRARSAVLRAAGVASLVRAACDAREAADAEWESREVAAERGSSAADVAAAAARVRLIRRRLGASGEGGSGGLAADEFVSPAASALGDDILDYEYRVWLAGRPSLEGAAGVGGAAADAAASAGARAAASMGMDPGDDDIGPDDDIGHNGDTGVGREDDGSATFIDLPPLSDLALGPSGRLSVARAGDPPAGANGTAGAGGPARAADGGSDSIHLDHPNHPSNGPPFPSLLDAAPFLLDTAAKARLVQVEAAHLKHAAARQARDAAFLAGAPRDRADASAWLHVVVRREALLEDALAALSGRPPRHFSRPLRVSFVSGGAEEDGLDEGGVAKEFFQLLLRETFDPAFGMFAPLGEPADLAGGAGDAAEPEAPPWVWPTPGCPEPPSSYRLVGQLLGLAVYNGHILDVRLAPLVYRALLGELDPPEDDGGPHDGSNCVGVGVDEANDMADVAEGRGGVFLRRPGLEDLAETHPTLALSLRRLLELSDDELRQAGLHASDLDAVVPSGSSPASPTPPPFPGDGSDAESDDPGPPIECHADARRLVDRCVDRVFGWPDCDAPSGDCGGRPDVLAAIASLRDGYRGVAGALQTARPPFVGPRELEILVRGALDLDWGALEAFAQYEGGYHPNHPTVRALWEVVRGPEGGSGTGGLSLRDRRRLLAFATGSDRAPVGGLGAVGLVVQRNGDGLPGRDGRAAPLPTSHTCFNVLLLPDYGSVDVLRERLTVALREGSVGFGLL